MQNHNQNCANPREPARRVVPTGQVFDGPKTRLQLCVLAFGLPQDVGALSLSIPSAFPGQRGYEPRFLDMAPLI
jgi:hypothetical protein